MATRGTKRPAGVAGYAFAGYYLQFLRPSWGISRPHELHEMASDGLGGHLMQLMRRPGTPNGSQELQEMLLQAISCNSCSRFGGQMGRMSCMRWSWKPSHATHVTTWGTKRPAGVAGDAFASHFVKFLQPSWGPNRPHELHEMYLEAISCNSCGHLGRRTARRSCRICFCMLFLAISAAVLGAKRAA